MHLDPLTLMFPGVVATGFASILLFGAWWQYRDNAALLWWSASNGLNAASIALLAAGFGLQIESTLTTGSGLGALSAVLVLLGTAAFSRFSISWLALMAGPIAWLAIQFAPLGEGRPQWVTITSFLIWTCYLGGAMWLLWASRTEPLMARWPLMGLLGLHGVVYAGATVEVLMGWISLGGPPPVDSWFGIIHFETILFAMGAAFFMVLLTKERRELGYIEAAKTDPLTSTANRGAFFDQSQRLFERCRQDGSPFSLIMFDLDRFKSVNDTYGHQLGDRILRDFADTVRLSLRPNDLFGRYGGEEFAVVLPGASLETAHAIAERIRQSFAQGNEFVDGRPIKATVSAGVAIASPDSQLDQIIEAADQAMYVAKRAGRNRVERAAPPVPEVDSGVIRIA